MNNILHVISSSDNNYAQHVGVMLVSIFANKKPDTVICVHIIDYGISVQNIDRLKSISTRYGFILKFVRIDDEHVGRLNMIDSKYIASYQKIFIPELFPQLEKVLSLDADIVVLGDLESLWKTDISSTYLAAVKDYHAGGQQKRPIFENGQYFNAGVMLINLKKWRENGITSKILRQIENPEYNHVFLEQNAINEELCNNFTLLSPIYNQLNYFCESRTDVDYSVYDRDELDSSIKDPVIIHFAGPDKPWLFHSKSKSKALYFRYKLKTPWRFHAPQDFTYKEIKYHFLSKHMTIYKFLRTLKNFVNIYA
jgi:lipopolysaccharide biosynthesis glycosyltransferase